MSIFQRCQKEFCSKIADLSCECSLESQFFCEEHFRDHRSQKPGRHPCEDILVPIIDEDISIIKESFNYIKTNELSATISQRNRAVNLLLQRIKEEDRVCSERINAILFTFKTIEDGLEEIYEKRMLSTVSDNKIFQSLGMLKKNSELIQQSIIQILSDLNDNLLSYAVKEANKHIEKYKNKLTKHTEWKKVCEIPAHQDSITSTSISPDRKHVATAGFDNTIKIWDLATQNLQKILIGHQNWINSMKYSSKGNFIVSGSQDKTIKIWRNGICVVTLNYVSSIASIDVSSDEKFIISNSSNENKILIWDTHSAECVKTLEGHDSDVNCVVFSSSGSLIASGSEKEIIIWSSETISTILEGHTDHVLKMVFSEDENLLISGSRDSTVKIWMASTGENLATFNGHSSAVYAIAYIHGIIVSASDDSTIKFWTVNQDTSFLTFEGHTSSYVNIGDICITPEYLISGGRDGLLRIWTPINN